MSKENVVFLNDWPQGKYEKRMGPRIEPCGTPQERLAGGGGKLPMLIEKLLFLR